MLWVVTDPESESVEGVDGLKMSERGLLMEGELDMMLLLLFVKTLANFLILENCEGLEER